MLTYINTVKFINFGFFKKYKNSYVNFLIRSANAELTYSLIPSCYNFNPGTSTFIYDKKLWNSHLTRWESRTSWSSNHILKLQHSTVILKQVLSLGVFYYDLPHQLMRDIIVKHPQTNHKLTLQRIQPDWCEHIHWSCFVMISLNNWWVISLWSSSNQTKSLHTNEWKQTH